MNSNKLFFTTCLAILFFQSFGQSGKNFNGSADFFTSYSLNNGAGTNSYDFYYSASVRQEVSVLGLPFEARLQLYSFRGYPSYLPNVFSFRFNTDDFIKRMRNRLNEKVEKEKISALARLGEKNTMLNEKAQLDEIFNHPSVVSDLEKLEKADSLRKILNTTQPDDIKGRSDVLKMLSDLEEVESRRDLYDNLKYRKKRYDEMLNMPETAVNSMPAEINNPDPAALRREMNKMGLLSGLENIAFCVERFEIGRFGVNWTDLTLRGVTLDGADIRIRPGKTTAGVVTGWIHPIFAYGYMGSGLQPKRSVIGGMVGYGSAGAQQVKVSVLQFDDGREQMNSTFTFHARKNYVISTEFSTTFFKNKIRLKGEASGSQTLFDKNAEQQPVYIGSVYVPPADPAENWIKNIFSGKKSSMVYSTGYALNADLQLERLLPGFTFILRSKYVTPFYQSFGAPYLASDMNGYEATAEKTFFKNRIAGFATWSHYSDNLESLKPFSTDWSRYVAGLRLNFPGLPSFSFGYQPIIQNSIKPVFIYSVFGQSVYTVNKNRNKNNFLLNYSFFSNRSGYQREFATHNIIGTYIYESPYRFGLTSLVSYYYSQLSVTATDRYRIQFIFNYTFYGKWRNGIGFQLQGTGAKLFSRGVLMESSIKAGTFLTFSLRAQYDNYFLIYSGDAAPLLQNRFFVTSNLIINW